MRVRGVQDANYICDVYQSANVEGFLELSDTPVLEGVPAYIEDISGGLGPQFDFTYQAAGAQYPYRIVVYAPNTKVDGAQVFVEGNVVIARQRKDGALHTFVDLSDTEKRRFVIQYVWLFDDVTDRVICSAALQEASS
jgi:hypothetical protein